MPAVGRRGDWLRAHAAVAPRADYEVSICLFLFPFCYVNTNSLNLLALLLWQEESDVLWREQGDAQKDGTRARDRGLSAGRCTGEHRFKFISFHCAHINSFVSLP